MSYGYTYDAADRVTQEVRTWDSGTIADTLTYSYTNNNQLTGVSHTNGSFSNESFTWDSNGNETGTGYTTGTDNEQTASPGYTYTYDHAGELTSETQTSTGDVWTYSYDFRGRMVTAVEKTSGGSTLESVTFTYDALDNRIGMDENSTQVWTLYDQGNSVMDFNSSGSLTMRYLWGPTGIVARQTSGGTVSWYLADQLGTVRDLLNNSGAIIDHVDFSAFGTVLDESSPTSGDRMMGFAGMERDTVTGLNLAVYREENPETGRWDIQDPLGFIAGDSDLYRYAGNAPTFAVDPNGTQEAVRQDDRGTGRPTFGGQRPGTGRTPPINTNPLTIEVGQDSDGKQQGKVTPGKGVPGLDAQKNQGQVPNPVGIVPGRKPRPGVNVQGGGFVGPFRGPVGPIGPPVRMGPQRGGTLSEVNQFYMQYFLESDPRKQAQMLRNRGRCIGGTGGGGMGGMGGGGMSGMGGMM